MKASHAITSLSDVSAALPFSSSLMQLLRPPAHSWDMGDQSLCSPVDLQIRRCSNTLQAGLSSVPVASAGPVIQFAVSAIEHSFHSGPEALVGLVHCDIHFCLQ